MADLITTPTGAALPALLGERYRVERELGSGGMSTVYLAHDVRHDRPVAIKILDRELATAVGPERFLAEIRTTASLQHAHILPLLDSGETDGTVYYVMPYVNGESLRQRLVRERQLPVADAVRIATELAAALDYAHRRGIVHRDIKPENVLLHDGAPLLADFGIALAIAHPRDGQRLTATGMSLGTPEYMSPEQAMGEAEVDARTDIYALGVVLYEMLAGEPPFTGASSQAVIAKVVTAEPAPIETLRRLVPPNVSAALVTALQKVAADRFGSAAAFADALANPRYESIAGVEQRVLRGASRERLSPRIVFTAAALLLLAALTLVWRRPAPVDSHRLVTRFEVAVPDSEASALVALSHDGLRLVWSSETGYFERLLDSLGVLRLRDGTPPVTELRDISPSGGEALVSGRGRLAIVPLGGGSARPLSITGARAPVWSDDGHVYFALADGAGRRARIVARVRPEGGAVDTVATLDGGVLSMTALPAGRGLVLSVAHGDTASLVALDLRSRRVRPLGAQGSMPQFVAPHALLFVSGTSVMAAPFDVGKLGLTAGPRLVETSAGAVRTLAARGDVLVYASASDAIGPGAQIVTRGAAARALPNIPDTLRFSGFTLSPDGSRLAMSGTPLTAAISARGGRPLANLYVYELAAQRLTRLGSDERDQNPAWLPNGRDLSFIRVRSDSPVTSALIVRAWDGTGLPATLLTRPGGARGSVLGPVAWLPNGRQAIVRVAAPGADARSTLPGDLMRFSPGTPQRLDTIVGTEYSESSPSLSQDGQLLAFTSDESGHTEVYVRALAGGAVHRISLDGGTLPHWSRTGFTLFFVDGDTLFATTIQRDGALRAGAVHPMLLSRRLAQGYAVLPGDSSFIVAASFPTSRFVVVTGIAAEIARLFPR